MAAQPEDPKALNDKYSSVPSDDSRTQELTWRRLFLRKGKLRASSRTSALMSGFAMVAMVEIQIDPGLPSGLIIAFSVLTTILISIHVFALMISVCILPNLDSFASSYSLNNKNFDNSLHEQMHYYIETAWLFSTGLGTLLFLAEVAIVAWVQFYNKSKAAAIASTCVLLPVGVVFIWFALHFYKILVKHKYEQSSQGLEELQMYVDKLQPTDIHTV
ncbi:calcium release-activated calcium channel 1-like isoform X2 [Paramuricea clavata]|uniref:Calcium release-activated calcium channel 1-like isoform X2 n=1 Tax=Paramuricea clavata TaxID=317549 RepID=A0A6S7I0A9_PARCT|nr:calcium release-activated calcium channel 1-like isoform X2 [Paramuricea clavata]